MMSGSLLCLFPLQLFLCFLSLLSFSIPSLQLFLFLLLRLCFFFAGFGRKRTTHKKATRRRSRCRSTRTDNNIGESIEESQSSQRQNKEKDVRTQVNVDSFVRQKMKMSIKKRKIRNLWETNGLSLWVQHQVPHPLHHPHPHPIKTWVYNIPVFLFSVSFPDITHRQFHEIPSSHSV